MAKVRVIDSDSSKPAWYPRYSSKILADTAVTLMTLAEEGAYNRLMDVQWNEGFIPEDVSELCCLLKHISRDEFEQLWKKVGLKFPKTDVPGRLANPKLAEMRAKYLAANMARCAKKPAKERRKSTGRRLGDDFAPAAPNVGSRLADDPVEEEVEVDLDLEGEPRNPDPSGGANGPAERQQPLPGVRAAPPPKRGDLAAAAQKKALQLEVGRVVGGYCAMWTERMRPSDGEGPTLTAADRGQAVKLAKTYGAQKALEYVARYLDDPDPWIAERGHPLALVGSRANAYRAQAPPSSPSRFREPCPPHAVTEEVPL